ncbi:glucosamine-6-phosphate deaminase [Erysipelothrix inopinata]|uniref:Glucosamine-6-phosphate deaminase n=1 Tax=Erysipelothrix inopinata TaxID=225084 RepID=A0A7G9RWC6_9FIRM|nr:glucosamine-6-phosphate deaminase [Erysipelothrix inopinata]QNN59901.1 glucosamine-6-phosphate deaminase [Erysipelothrix inopinata]
MKLYVVEDNIEGAKLGYDIIAKELKDGNLNVFGLATGSTPITFYNELTASDLDFTNTVSVNLDEYIGLAADHDQSYHYFMNEHLFAKKPFKANYLPNGLEENAEVECARYNKIIADNPIDVQILGIGENGHIGFNEPGASFDSLTEKVALTESTIKANSRNFASIEDVPRFAYSMGIKSILSAKKIVLFAYGEAKKDAIYGMLEETPSTDLPASALQNHDDVIVIVDKQAASRLDLTKYQ